MSRKADKPKAVSVYVRCRPRNTTEKNAGSHSIVDCSKKEVIVKHGNSNMNKKYTFDHVYGPNSTQVDVYKGVAHSTIEEVLQGYNCTVFAYGQTGTGKTYTMEGDRSNGKIPWETDPKIGLIPRCMSHMFDRLNSQASDFSVRVSMLELYNEELFDLLSAADSTTKLRLFEDSTRKVTRGIGSVVIQGLEEVQVASKDEVYALMERAMLKRKTAETLLNACSSRSHVVFTVTVHIKSASQDESEEEEVFKMGKFNLVDLAGSENIGRSGALNARAREAGNINQSLLTLGRVITALVDRAPHVPYRESKLTRLLQDSLGGRTQTSIIATISPAACNMEETLSTLDYANRAKNILNKPEVNQRSSKRALIKEYTAEIEKLKRELLLSREKSGVYMDVEKFNEMESRMKCQSVLIKDKEDKLAALEGERTKIGGLFSNTIRQIDGLHKKIDRKEVVETQNKTLISNFITSARSQYSMFEEYLSQHKEQVEARSANMSALLDKSAQQDAASREQGRRCLDELMQTVVKGLDKASQLRDQQHESWFSDFFTKDLIPAIEQMSSNVEDLHNHSTATTASFVSLMEEDYAKLDVELNEMEERLQYTISSAERECQRLLSLSENIQAEVDRTKEARQELLRDMLLKQQAAMETMNENIRASARAQEERVNLLMQRSEQDLLTINTFSNKSEGEYVRNKVEMSETASELLQSLKHGSESVLKTQVKQLRDHNNKKTHVISEVQSSSTGYTTRINLLRKNCSDIQHGLERSRGEHSAQVQSSASAQHHSSLLSQDRDDAAHQTPHLREIFEKRCEQDTVITMESLQREEIIQALTKEAGGLWESSTSACTQSEGLLTEAATSLNELKRHVKEDLPTGATPKRAKLNRLKLAHSSNFASLDSIESDEENSDPNKDKDPVMDMSFQ